MKIWAVATLVHISIYVLMGIGFKDVQCHKGLLRIQNGEGGQIVQMETAPGRRPWTPAEFSRRKKRNLRFAFPPTDEVDSSASPKLEVDFVSIDSLSTNYTKQDGMKFRGTGDGSVDQKVEMDVPPGRSHEASLESGLGVTKYIFATDSTTTDEPVTDSTETSTVTTTEVSTANTTTTTTTADPTTESFSTTDSTVSDVTSPSTSTDAETSNTTSYTTSVTPDTTSVMPNTTDVATTSEVPPIETTAANVDKHSSETFMFVFGGILAAATVAVYAWHMRNLFKFKVSLHVGKHKSYLEL